MAILLLCAVGWLLSTNSSSSSVPRVRTGERQHRWTLDRREENLEKYNLDAGIICSPSSFHVKESIKLLKQRINIFVEKPLGSNLSNIKNLEKTLITSKKINMMGYQLKFCPIINSLKNIIKIKT